jgi:putative transcriptional regulator
MKSLKGRLILDGGKLAGSPFHRTVVLICHHDPEGAFGLVLNRKSETKIEDVLTESLPDAVGEQPLYLGGPVRPQALSCLIHDPTINGTTEDVVMPGLRIAHTLDGLPTQAQLKFFAGYAGWSPGQLDNEMKRKDWLTHPASIDHIFHPQPEGLWKSIVRTKGPEYLLLAEAPDDLSHN